MGHYKGKAVPDQNPASGRVGRVASLVVVLLGGCASQLPASAPEYVPEIPPAAETQTIAVPEQVLPPPPTALPVRVKTDMPLTYVVKKGDTLWGISNHFLLDPWQWPEIWVVNDKVRNPHLIYPGDVLKLLTVDGRPQLVAETVESQTVQTLGVDKLGPHVRESALGSAVPAIPIDQIRDFLLASKLVTLEEIAKAPYIVAFEDPQIVAGAGSRAYVKNARAADGSAYNLVRLGNAYRDPDNNELLGYEAIPVGNAQISAFDGAIVSADLVRTTREVRPGDRLFPLEEDTYGAYFYPKAPKVAVNGRIIAVLDGVSQITEYQVVALNRGARQGIERGDVLSVLQTGRAARDPYGASADSKVVLPDLDAGTVLVFKVTPRVSYALLMNATRAIHKLDRVTNPTPRR